MIQLKTFQGHIVLLCKGHYNYDDFFDALKKIWAVRCGFDQEHIEDSMYEYIADDMYEIISKCLPDERDGLIQYLHNELVHPALSTPKVLSPIETVIWYYRSVICGMTVNKTKDGVTTRLINLPKPEKEIFTRILKGEGKYEDYDLIIEKDKQHGHQTISDQNKRTK